MSGLRRYSFIPVLLRRAVVMWILVRMVIATVGAAAGASGEAAVSAGSPVGVVLVVIALGFIDVRRRGERMLWLNLGVSGVMLGTMFGATSLLGELALAQLGR